MLRCAGLLRRSVSHWGFVFRCGVLLVVVLLRCQLLLVAVVLGGQLLLMSVVLLFLLLVVAVSFRGQLVVVVVLLPLLVVLALFLAWGGLCGWWCLFCLLVVFVAATWLGWLARVSGSWRVVRGGAAVGVRRATVGRRAGGRHNRYIFAWRLSVPGA